MDLKIEIDAIQEGLVETSTMNHMYVKEKEFNSQ
jgi:hypothetical protein